ncbi:hypothetical protein M2105_003924 [Paenibacillus sp. PastF-1]|nr:hypothetical protein [Paenibacillus sp. PastF-2]MDF9849569.1 hypothetical protein [Paenibacillus sp. PastM-2]MDF9856056.1 hypothetical protein [Paenibacillus sp. PastF-1]MDH6481412.1 hypothetical protein [Paenibacillus sp. PastH-2]MDH6508745.1 hypothetical protein [Paenibacillus sp. PastM-3]
MEIIIYVYEISNCHASYCPGYADTLIGNWVKATKCSLEFLGFGKSKKTPSFC